MKAPFLFSFPGLIAKDVRSNAPMGLADIAPMLLELQGMPAPKTLQGNSLVAILLRKVTPPIIETHFLANTTIQRADWSRPAQRCILPDAVRASFIIMSANAAIFKTIPVNSIIFGINPRIPPSRARLCFAVSNMPSHAVWITSSVIRERFRAVLRHAKTPGNCRNATFPWFKPATEQHIFPYRGLASGRTQKEKALKNQGFSFGSPGRARTYNNSVNSRVLCH